MSNTATINAVPALSVNNGPVTVTLAVTNNDGVTRTITDVFRQEVDKAYGPLSKNMRAALIGQTIPAGQTVSFQWQERYSCSDYGEQYGVDIILQLDAGAAITPTVAAGGSNKVFVAPNLAPSDLGKVPFPGKLDFTQQANSGLLLLLPGLL